MSKKFHHKNVLKKCIIYTLVNTLLNSDMLKTKGDRQIELHESYTYATGVNTQRVLEI
jgi:hypothetical protein